MLSPVIKQKIETKFGMQIRYPKDCDALAITISDFCKCKISGSTIKRLFGMIKGTDTPRLWTLDLMALYIGFNSWNELANQLAENKTKKKDELEILFSKNLKRGMVYKIRFGKTSSITLEYQGSCLYAIIDQAKTVLMKLDILEIEKIQLHFPLLIKKIKRTNSVMESILIGSVTGVTEITEVNRTSKTITVERIEINSIS